MWCFQSNDIDCAPNVTCIVVSRRSALWSRFSLLASLQQSFWDESAGSLAQIQWWTQRRIQITVLHGSPPRITIRECAMYTVDTRITESQKTRHAIPQSVHRDSHHTGHINSKIMHLIYNNIINPNAPILAGPVQT